MNNCVNLLTLLLILDLLIWCSNVSMSCNAFLPAVMMDWRLLAWAITSFARASCWATSARLKTDITKYNYADQIWHFLSIKALWLPAINNVRDNIYWFHKLIDSRYIVLKLYHYDTHIKPWLQFDENKN